MAKRVIPTREIMDDIRAGMGDVPIMEKHQISPAEYQAVLRKLQEVRALTKQELAARMSAVPGDNAGQQMRSVPRNYMFFTIPIYDANDPRVVGVVNDLTEKGLQVAGIPARVDEVKTFLIRPDVFPVEMPLAFDATCRWVNVDRTTGQYVAGFEITHIQRKHLGTLRKLISEITFQENL
jgi:hypothetical protein